MPSWIWIVIAVVVVALIVLAVGLARGRRRRVSLTPPQQGAVPDGQEGQQGATKPPAKGGGYRAGGSISFSAGSAATLDRPPAEAAEVVEAAEGAEIAPPPATTEAAAPAEAMAPPEAVAPIEAAAPAEAADGAVTESTEAVTESTAPTVEPVAEPPSEPATEPIEAPVGSVPIETEAPVGSVTAETELPVGSVTAETEVPVGPVTAEEIAPTAGRLSRLRGRLARSQSVFGRSLLGLLGAGDLDEDSWQEVEDTLLMADLGSASALEITETLRNRVAAHGAADTAAARTMLRAVLIDAVGPEDDRSVRALPHDGRPAVALVVGVNGTGKTTTTGKLARVLVADGRSVVLGAADTFRAAAADQLATWGERVGATVVRGAERADPAAVAYDAVRTGIQAGSDAVLIDTAGRLHTKTGLMDELGKVKRVVEKLASVDEVLLVLDATTGQNGLVQAKVFAEVVNVTGIVLTKLDGTAKGGIVVAVQRALGVPVKLVGLGEGPDDLAPFEPAAFVDALLGD